MFDRNLEFIDNEPLKERLKKITLEKSSKNMSYCMTPSNDYLLMKNNVPIDDINNPREAIKTMLKSTIKHPIEVNDIIITFGIGLGYLLDEVYNTYNSKIYVYEPDTELLHFVLNNVDISEHLASGRVYITDDLNELLRKLSSSYITKDKVEIVYLKNYAVVKSQELLKLTQKVYETCKSKMVDVNTIIKFSKRWLMNALRNIAKVNSSSVCRLSDLEGSFTGQTALILAAGPSLAENIEIINEKCHDLKHQIAFLREDKSDKYISEIEKAVMIYDSTVKTGSAVLDILLTERKLQCESKGIKLTVVVNGKLLEFMDEMEVYSLFGNALSNAIESVSSLPQEERHIALKVARLGDMCSIHVENPYKGEIKFSEDLPETTRDKKWHGFGMKSMNRIVTSYGGVMAVTTENGMFSLDILMPIESK